MPSLLKLDVRWVLRLRGDLMPVVASFDIPASDADDMSMLKLSRVGSGYCLVEAPEAE